MSYDMKEVHNVFQLADYDGNGTIGGSELRHLLVKLNPSITEDDSRRLLEEIDSNADGRIDYKEFLEWVSAGSVEADYLMQGGLMLKPLASLVKDDKNLCIRGVLCGKPTWNGKPGYCSKSCKEKGPLPECINGCGKSTWNGEENEKCSKGCKAKCANLSCDKSSWNGKKDEYCSKNCRNAANQPWRELSKDDPEKFQSLVDQFEKTWDEDQVGKIAKPKVKFIYDVHTPDLVTRFKTYAREVGGEDKGVKVFGKGENPGNKQRRFHGTRTVCAFKKGRPCDADDCVSCLIIKGGFKMAFCKPGGDFFGLGLYTSPSSSTAARYAKDKAKMNGVVIVVGVVIGRAELIDGATIDEARGDKLRGSGCADGYHSRIIDDAYKAHPYAEHAKNCGEPLLKSYEEVITFRDESLIPKYLIIFESSGT